ncbi:ATP-binding cassette domain-containing protein [Leeia oryzae]|uniref:ATP-binding cassette domain-containing protein n=1 Tax=Leeia oryzae TaxID=356662 RepID=UPI0003675DCB|nr:ATP-binding cassette domain-containing protein [Leeia oryzae]
MAVLKVEHLCKQYASELVVNQLSLTIPAGICFGLLGPNGAGKTTTLKLCLGLITPDSGSIELMGMPVPDAGPKVRLRVGVVPQFDNLDPDFSVAENLIIFGRYFGIKPDVVRANVPELLAFAGLEGKEKSRIRELSGGMRRRLTLARALVNDPDVIFLDEPTTGLDPQARHLIWERLRQLVAKGKTLILTTHFMDEAERLCNCLAIMDHGKIIAEDSPKRLIENLIEPVVVEVFGDGLDDWLATVATGTGCRIERAGETIFCYGQDATAVLQSMVTFPGLKSVVRQANLEDVFIKITGRELRD